MRNSPGITTSGQTAGQKQIEISTIHSSEQKTGSSELWKILMTSRIVCCLHMAASLRLGNTSVYVDSEWTNIDITPVLPERKFVPKQIYSMAIKCWQQLQLSSSRRSGWLYIIGCSVLLSTASLTKNLVLQLVPLSSLSCSWITRDMDFTCPHDDMASHFLIEVLLSPLKLKASHPKRYFTYADIKGAHKESGLCICIMWHYIIWLHHVTRALLEREVSRST